MTRVATGEYCGASTILAVEGSIVARVTVKGTCYTYYSQNTDENKNCLTYFSVSYHKTSNKFVLTGRGDNSHHPKPVKDP